MLEVSRRLHLTDGLHDSVANERRNIRATISLSTLAEVLELLGGEGRGGRPEMDLEHRRARRRLGEADVDTLLETPADGRVEPPGDVGGGEDEDAVGVVADTVHLDEELGLDAAGRLTLVVGTGRAERIDLIDEDDAGTLGTGHVEEGLHKLLGLTEPLGEKGGGGDGEEGRVVGLGGNSLGEERLTGTRGLHKKRKRKKNINCKIIMLLFEQKKQFNPKR